MIRSVVLVVDRLASGASAHGGQALSGKPLRGRRCFPIAKSPDEVAANRYSASRWNSIIHVDPRTPYCSSFIVGVDVLACNGREALLEFRQRPFIGVEEEPRTRNDGVGTCRCEFLAERLERREVTGVPRQRTADIPRQPRGPIRLLPPAALARPRGQCLDESDLLRPGPRRGRARREHPRPHRLAAFDWPADTVVLTVHNSGHRGQPLPTSGP